MKLFYKWFGHKWETDWVARRMPSLGAVVVEINTCKRCNESHSAFTTSLRLTDSEVHYH